MDDLSSQRPWESSRDEVTRDALLTLESDRNRLACHPVSHLLGKSKGGSRLRSVVAFCLRFKLNLKLQAALSPTSVMYVPFLRIGLYGSLASSPIKYGEMTLLHAVLLPVPYV